MTPNCGTWANNARRLKCYGNLGDLERLYMLLGNLDDERLMLMLEERRGNGRDDYPIRAIWNSLLAFVVFGHNSIESLRRELWRNGQLRDICGFDPLATKPVPSSNAYSNFIRLLECYTYEYTRILANLYKQLGRLLPGFGQHIAIDSKVIQSVANSRSEKEPDGRRDVDGGWAKKTYTAINGKTSTKRGHLLKGSTVALTYPLVLRTTIFAVSRRCSCVLIWH